MSVKSKSSSVNAKHSEQEISLENPIEEVHLTLDQLMNLRKIAKLPRRASVEDNLLEKHKLSQAKLTRERIRKKSDVFKDLKQVPTISVNSSRISLPRYNTEIRAMLESMQQILPQEEEMHLRPRDVIPAPDLESVKALFSSRSQTDNQKKDVFNPSRLTLLEKTKYFTVKRQQMIKDGLEQHELKVKRACTFKPDLGKTLPKHRNSTESVHKTTENNDKRLESCNPAPKPNLMKGHSQDFGQKANLDLRAYDDLSPAKRSYSFKEGVNVKKMIQKAKPMILYDASSKN